MLVFLFRDPRRSLIYLDPNLQRAQYQYQWYWGFGEATAAPLNAKLFPLNTTIEADVEFGVPTGATTYTPHGNLMVAAKPPQSNRRYMWIDASGAGITSVVFTFLALSTGAINRYQWQEGEEVLIDQTAVAGVGSIAINFGNNGFVNVSGYYAFEFVNFTAPAGGFNVTSVIVTTPAPGAGAPVVFCHLTIPQLYQNDGNTEEMRVLGGNLLIMNEASPLNQQGNIVNAFCGKTQQWEHFAHGSYPTIFSEADAKSRLLATGLYTYLKPSEETDFAMLPIWIQGDAGVVGIEPYPLVCDSSYQAIAANTTNTLGGDAKLRVRYPLEFKTNNLWLDQEAPKGALGMYIRAIAVVNTMEDSFENPIHWGKILSAIGKVAGTVGRIAGPLISLLPDPRAKAIGMGITAASSFLPGFEADREAKEKEIQRENNAPSATTPTTSSYISNRDYAPLRDPTLNPLRYTKPQLKKLRRH